MHVIIRRRIEAEAREVEWYNKQNAYVNLLCIRLYHTRICTYV